MPILSALLAHARSTPDRIAVASPAGSLTYGGLAREAVALRQTLSGLAKRQRANRFAPETITALSIGNAMAFFPVFAAATSGGHALAIIPPSLPEDIVADTLLRLTPDCVLADPDRAGRIRASGGLDPDIVIGTPADLKADLDPVDLPEPGDVDGDPSSTFLIGLTSGTTSRPKMFYRSRRSWSLSLAQHESAFGLTAADVVLAPGPLSHGLTTYAAAEALTAGARFVFLQRFDPETALAMIEAEAVTRLTLVPAMLHDLCARASAPVPAVTTILSAGAKLSENLRRRAANLFPNAELLEYYGASELSFVTLTPPATSRDGPVPPASIGKAFPGVTISIRDATGAHELPDGSVGTLFVDSPLISEGYLGEPEASGSQASGAQASGFVRVGRWASVGDRAWRDAAGFLTLAGREGDVINCGGNSFYPAELEAVLVACPGIDAACVLGLPDRRLGQIAVAVLEADGVTRARVEAHCARHLARYKIPRHFYRTAKLPRTESGKVAARAVLAMIETGTDMIELQS